ncbi:protein of unknown function [Methylocella tundrae]|uniref:Uncharacterized protein n=1 Tax=Methylocella tundrae TaxID=227605 RepID=A0A4U8Z3V2_METTU|nr:protein of unknown function [Methylocella tundrae]
MPRRRRLQRRSAPSASISQRIGRQAKRMPGADCPSSRLAPSLVVARSARSRLRAGMEDEGGGDGAYHYLPASIVPIGTIAPMHRGELNRTIIKTSGGTIQEYKSGRWRQVATGSGRSSHELLSIAYFPLCGRR